MAIFKTLCDNTMEDSNPGKTGNKWPKLYDCLAHHFERVSRPWGKKWGSQLELGGYPNWRDRAENPERPGWLGFTGQDTREERHASRERGLWRCAEDEFQIFSRILLSSCMRNVKDWGKNCLKGLNSAQSLYSAGNSAFSHEQNLKISWSSFIYFLWGNDCSTLCPFLNWLFWLLFSCGKSFIFWKSIHYQIYDLQICFLIYMDWFLLCW